MSDIILHHYPGSPFSQKVRWVFGYKGIAWKSVITPTVMPKPDVTALTGGYRRAPFMQIGADIYCDSALICQVIDRLQPEPPLYPTAIAGLAETVAQWADSSLFWTAVPYTLQPAGVVYVLQGATPEMMKAFAADRAAMNPNFRRPTIADGGAALHTYLLRLEALLADGRTFLLGAAACIADFSAAQSIWFLRLAPPVAEMLVSYPKVEAWYRAVDAFGQGQFSKMTSAEALSVAAEGGQAPVSFAAENGLEHGASVTVTPTDYAHDPVAGRLVGLSHEESVVERRDDRAGLVRVHFPRIGFQVKVAEAAR